MSILFTVKKRKNPGNASAPEKFYLISKIRGHKKHKNILEDAARNITSSPKEVDLSVSAWSESVVRSLSDGFSVEVAEFGTFSVSIRSEGSDTEEDATVAKKESVQINFKASPELRDMVNRFHLEKFDPNKSL
ncbi:MAG: HU family DNA-binding protein [Prevotellaceae bacterium]|jgi:nucleoid DNA-binding protein|nr:HU family DNA-binding protein [Prevotellaceae bacterium]